MWLKRPLNRPRRGRKPRNRKRHWHGHGQCANALSYRQLALIELMVVVE
jgi:hypothetical protein